MSIVGLLVRRSTATGLRPVAVLRRTSGVTVNEPARRGCDARLFRRRLLRCDPCGRVGLPAPRLHPGRPVQDRISPVRRKAHAANPSPGIAAPTCAITLLTGCEPNQLYLVTHTVVGVNAQVNPDQTSVPGRRLRPHLRDRHARSVEGKKPGTTDAMTALACSSVWVKGITIKRYSEIDRHRRSRRRSRKILRPIQPTRMSQRLRQRTRKRP